MLQYPTPTSVHGRYAPSPTGLLHVGSARTALAAWLSARAAGGHFTIRMEDLDGPRTMPGMADAALRDLAWLGLDWDAGPIVGGPYAPYRQSERRACYEAALERLFESGRLFPCTRSRRDLARLATAPHGYGGMRPYSASLRPTSLAPDWFDRCRRGALEAALRFRVADGVVSFEDRLQGPVVEDVSATVGDFVVKRRDGVYAYQLATTVDDLMMGVTEVVRGEDLLASTARQIQLVEALGGRPMAYGHVPLVHAEDGPKLSKRDGDLTISALREGGLGAEELVGRLGRSLGLVEAARPCTPRHLLERFAWKRLSKNPWKLAPEEFGR